MNFTGIILAAGASSRMGTPKALLKYKNETFVDRLVDAIASNCDTVVVVLGHHADAIRSGMRLRHVPIFVENPAPERGQLSSLQCGLSNVPATAGGVLFLPVDYPAVRPATVRRLIENFGATAFTIPTCAGQHGHPILFRREIAQEFLALPSDASAREIVHQHRADTAYVEVDDPGVLRDIDDPAAYHQLLAASEPS